MGKRRGKRYRQCLQKVPAGPVPLEQAVQVVKDFPPTQFDATVEIAIKLGIDAKQADQIVRGAVSLPHGIGAARKVVAFCEGEDVQKAKDAGAIEAGGDDLIQKIQDGWMDFDVAIATKGMMRSVSKLGRVLGPQGKMPSPKAGTVVDDVTTAVREYAAGKVEFRNDDGGNIHAVIGKQSFEADKLVANAQAFLETIRRMRPSTAKGVYMQKVVLSAAMTPGVAVAAEQKVTT